MKNKLLPHQRRKADGATSTATDEYTEMFKGWRFYQPLFKEDCRLQPWKVKRGKEERKGRNVRQKISLIKRDSLAP